MPDRKDEEELLEAYLMQCYRYLQLSKKRRRGKTINIFNIINIFTAGTKRKCGLV